MKKRVRQAVLKVMLLQEEFTKSELNEAAVFLSNGEVGDLIECLRDMRTRTGNRNVSTPARDKHPISKAVKQLEDSDPERYSILAEFESMVRSGSMLREPGDIKKLGITASKHFQPGKSRKDSIPRLMEVLAAMPIEEMKDTVRKVTEQSKESAEGESSYGRLAQYIIGGDQATQ